MWTTLDCSDGDVARAIAARDAAAESELYRRFAPRVRWYGLRHLRDEEAARDLVQQVMLLVIEKLRAGLVRDVDQIASFILGVSRTIAIDVKRLERRRQTIRDTFMVSEIATSPGDDAALDVDHLERCLARLAARERMVAAPDLLRREECRRSWPGAWGQGRQRARHSSSRNRATSDVHDVRPGGVTMAACQAPIPEATLLDYWSRDLAGAESERLEEHLFGCGDCSERLNQLAAIGTGLMSLVRQGRLSGIVSRALLNRLQRDGVRVRMYSLLPGETVACAVFPGDDLVVTSLRADFTSVHAVTLSVTGAGGTSIAHFDDVPLPGPGGEVLYVTPAAAVHEMPSIRLQLTLSSAGDATVELGRYTLEHSASEKSPVNDDSRYHLGATIHVQEDSRRPRTGRAGGRHRARARGVDRPAERWS